MNWKSSFMDTNLLRLRWAEFITFGNGLQRHPARPGREGSDQKPLTTENTATVRELGGKFCRQIHNGLFWLADLPWRCLFETGLGSSWRSPGVREGNSLV
jgi:hypothetical protein